MGFTNSQLHLLSQADYNQQLFNSIGGSEGLETKVRNIGDGVATIGYGYTFNSHNNNYATFVAAGIVFTSTQADAIRHIDEMVRAGNSNANITSYALQNLSSLTMTKSMGLALFTQSVSEYDNSYIRNNFALSIERIALINISYNTPARIGLTRAPLLINAMQTGDRIATWYYLRFPEDGLATVDAKYKVGILNRHFDAATSFGYLDNDFNLSSNIGKNYIKYMYRFLEERQTFSIQYVNNILNAVINDSSFHGEIGVGAEIDVAKQILISEFSMGITIDGKVIVGSGIGNNGEKYADTSAGNDTLTGTSSNDLIFGERGNDTLSGGAGSDVLYGGDDTDTLMGNNGNDYLEGGKGSDTLYGDAGHDVLLGDNDSDVLYGGEGSDTLIGGDNDNASDALFGGSGEDVLLGGGGDDTLVGGDASNLYTDKVSDYLAGGVGYDIYYVSHQDIINDADSNGFIMFNNKTLNGKKTKIDEYTYEDTNFTYTLDGNNLIVVDKNLGEYITIEYFKNNAMGIELDKDADENDPTKKDIEIYVGDATVTEGGTLEFTIGIDNTLEADLVVNVSSYLSGSASSADLSGTTNGTITIKAGTTYGTFEIDTLDDTIVEPTEKFIFAVTGVASYTGNDMNSYLIKNAGEGTIVDNDKKTDKDIALSIGMKQVMK